MFRPVSHNRIGKGGRDSDFLRAVLTGAETLVGARDFLLSMPVQVAPETHAASSRVAFLFRLVLVQVAVNRLK